MIVYIEILDVGLLYILIGFCLQVWDEFAFVWEGTDRILFIGVILGFIYSRIIQIFGIN